MELKINISDNLKESEYVSILHFLQIVSKDRDIDIDKRTVLNLEDGIDDKQFGRGKLGLSEEYTLNIDEIVNIDEINRNFDIKKLNEVPKDKLKYLHLEHLAEIDFEYIKTNKEYFNWDILTYLDIPEDFIDENIELFDMTLISTKSFSMEFLLKHVNQMDIKSLVFSTNLYNLLDIIFNDKNIEPIDYILFLQKVDSLPESDLYLTPYIGHLRDMKIKELIS